MRWLKRGLWLSAWCVWAWLGFGLYRELPRRLGPQVCKLPLEVGEHPVGFLDGEDVVVSQFSNSAEFACRDARTGKQLRRWRGPSSVFSIPYRSLRHGLVYFVRTSVEQTLNVLDLRTLEITTLPNRCLFIGEHPERPLAALQMNRDKHASERIMVVDVRSGKSVAEWVSERTPASSVDTVQEVQFVGDDVLLLVERNTFHGNPAFEQRIERWNLATGERPPAIRFSASFEGWSKVKGGRILMRRDEEAAGIDVVDVQNGVTIQANIAERLDKVDRSSRRRMAPPAELSTSGNTMSSTSGALWSVADRRVLWSPKNDQETLYVENAISEVFLVREKWGELLKEWHVNLKLEAWAVRDFETGKVRYRTWDSHPSLRSFSSDHRLAVEDGGQVYAFPPAPNYALLALVQMVLASPLLILWFLMRRRRASAPNPIDRRSIP